jgi:hypothetical protein
MVKLTDLSANALEQYAVQVRDENDDCLAALPKVHLRRKQQTYVTSTLFHQDLDLFWKGNKIEQVGNPTSWRIVKETDDGESRQLEEVVFTLTGVIASKDLPPLRDRPRYVLYAF